MRETPPPTDLLQSARQFLAICALLLLSAAHSPAEDTLVKHTFDDGAESLNMMKVDGGSLQTGSLEWVTAVDTEMNRNGVINLGAGDEKKKSQRAFVALNSAITKGGKDDIYTLKIVIVNNAENTSILTGGFFTSTVNEPNVLGSHDKTDGIAWWYWRAKGEMKASAGPGFTAKEQPPHQLPGAGDEQTLTTVLDFTGYNGSDNLGTMSVYAGGTASGEPIFSAKFTEDNPFDYVGFTAQRFQETDAPVMSEIKSLTLTKGRQP